MIDYNAFWYTVWNFFGFLNLFYWKWWNLLFAVLGPSIVSPSCKTCKLCSKLTFSDNTAVFADVAGNVGVGPPLAELASEEADVLPGSSGTDLFDIALAFLQWQGWLWKVQSRHLISEIFHAKRCKEQFKSQELIEVCASLWRTTFTLPHPNIPRLYVRERKEWVGNPDYFPAPRVAWHRVSRRYSHSRFDNSRMSAAQTVRLHTTDSQITGWDLT